MIMERSVTFLLYCLFLGVAMAAAPEMTGDVAEQDKAPLKRVRRGLINVQKRAADEMFRLSNEFGEGDERDLQSEDMDMMMSMSMSMSLSPPKSKGKSKGRRTRRYR